MFRDDGSVESANSTNADNLSQNETSFDGNIYRCLVLDRYFNDDEINPTSNNPSPSTLYRVIVIGGFNDGKIIDNVRPSKMFGGPFNNEETVFRTNTIKETQNLSTINADGDIVYVAFVNQNIYDPVIIGCETSPLDKKRSSASKADGTRWTWEFNAIRNLIDKTGKWIKTKFVGKTNSNNGEYEPTEEVEIKESWETEKITKEFKTGLKIEEDGANDKVSITTNGEVLTTVDGKSGTVTIDVKGSSVVTVNQDGTITLTADTKINLLAPEVDVGDAAALSATRFEALKAEFDKHVHNAPQAPAGIIPTTPPLAPLISVVGSATVKIND